MKTKTLLLLLLIGLLSACSVNVEHRPDYPTATYDSTETTTVVPPSDVIVYP